MDVSGQRTHSRGSVGIITTSPNLHGEMESNNNVQTELLRDSDFVDTPEFFSQVANNETETPNAHGGYVAPGRHTGHPALGASGLFLFRLNTLFKKLSPRLHRLSNIHTANRYISIPERLAVNKPSALQKSLWNATDDFIANAFGHFIRSNSMSSWKAYVFKSDAWNNTFEDPEELLDCYCKLIPVNNDICQNIFGVLEENKEGIKHFHVMVKTQKRVDSVRRMFHDHMTKHNFQDYVECVKGQSVRNLEGLFKYFLKNPLAVLCGTANIMSAAVSVLSDEEQQWKENTQPKAHKDVDHLLKIMSQHNVFTLEDLMKTCPTEIKHLLARPSLNTIVQNCALYLNVKSDLANLKKRFLDQASFGQVNRRKIDAFLERQKVDPVEFAKDLHEWLWQEHPKKNTFVLYGPPNTGKSSFIRPLVALFRWGQILQAHQFMFQNCLRKEIVVWEEPLISKDFADKCKLLFEGSTQMVEVKSHAPQLLERTPIIITTNKPIWQYCSSDKLAFQARCYIYTFNAIYSDDSSRSKRTRTSSGSSTSDREGIRDQSENTRTNSCSPKNSPGNASNSSRISNIPSRTSSPKQPNSPRRDSNDNLCCSIPVFDLGDDERGISCASQDIECSQPTRPASNCSATTDNNDCTIEYDSTAITDGGSPTIEPRYGPCPCHGPGQSFDSRTLCDIQSGEYPCTCKLLRGPRKLSRSYRANATNRRGKGSLSHISPRSRSPYKPDCEEISPASPRRRRPDNLRATSKRSANTRRQLDWEASVITGEDWIDWLAYHIKLFEPRIHHADD